MNDWRLRTAGLAVVLMAACNGGSHSGGGPAAPVAPSPAPTPAAAQASGATVNALSGSGIQGVSIAADGLVAATSSADGSFMILAPGAGDYKTTFSGPDLVDRRTELRVPASNVQVSLIPKSFDLASFDQLVRQSGARLQRWIKAPGLVIIGTELAFGSLTAASAVATDVRMSAADLTALSSDLTGGLPQMTGGSYTAFASSATETPAVDSNVSVLRDGLIVVARYQGLTAATGYAGFGRWATTSDGVVTAGIIFYDAGVDRSAAASVRRALHVHEMGHALGYSHVTNRQSVMNPSPAVDPNDFDKDATRIAFQRPPGSISPDIDPATFVATSSGALRALARTPEPGTWGPPIP